jgi:hypothetical protein
MAAILLLRPPRDIDWFDLHSDYRTEEGSGGGEEATLPLGPLLKSTFAVRHWRVS